MVSLSKGAHTKETISKLGEQPNPSFRRRPESRTSASDWWHGDEVYGNDRRLRAWLEGEEIPHVLAIRSNEKLWAWTDRGSQQVRADRLAPEAEESGWVRCSAGDGAKGPRIYDWALVKIRPLREPGQGHWLLARRSIAKPGELAYYVCFGPEGTTLDELVRVAGTRWAIEECFEEAKGQSLPSRRRGWDWTSTKCANGLAGTGTSRWRCWPTPTWRWSGTRPGTRHRCEAAREKRGVLQLGRKADTPDGARSAAVALPAGMEAPPVG